MSGKFLSALAVFLGLLAAFFFAGTPEGQNFLNLYGKSVTIPGTGIGPVATTIILGIVSVFVVIVFSKFFSKKESAG